MSILKRKKLQYDLSKPIMEGDLLKKEGIHG